MTTAEHDGVWPRLVERERAEPCILSVVDVPVRVRARVLRPLLRVLCPRAPAGTRRPHRREPAAVLLSRAPTRAESPRVCLCLHVASSFESTQGRRKGRKIKSGPYTRFQIRCSEACVREACAFSVMPVSCSVVPGQSTCVFLHVCSACTCRHSHAF